MHLRSALAAAVAVAASPALAHTGIGSTTGFVHGFGHPIGGPDHVLAMVAVGLLAAQIGGRAVWLVPAAFMGLMAAGAALGMAGTALPAVEIAIGLSIVILGLAVAAAPRLPLIGAMLMVGAFAIFHGHAHGAEMPDDGAGATYGAGFMVATGLLHAIGVGLGLGVGRFASPTLVRVAGGGVAFAGLALLARLA